MRSQTLLAFGITGLLFTMLPGCAGSIVGHWSLTKAVPNKQTLAIDDASFARDGRYSATVTIEGKTVREEGRYKYNGFKLTMLPGGGGQHRYNTMIRGGTMQIIEGERKLILRKASKSQDK